MEVADDAIVALVNLSGLVDTEQELARLSKQQEKKQSAVESLNKRMEGAGWDKIPEEVREKDEEAKRKLDDELAAISKAIALMEAMQKAAAAEE